MDFRAKYTQDEIDALGKKGQAFGPDDDGHYSYPVADVADLKKAIRAVGRGNADHDKIRKYLIGRAKDLDESDLIPDNWNADGSLSDADKKSRVWHGVEQRDTAMDVFATLDGAVGDAYPDCSSWLLWVQDWYGNGSTDDPYTVVFCMQGAMWAAEFEYDDDGKVTIDVENAREVRPSTSYIDRSRRNKALPSRPRVDMELRAARDGMRGVREARRMPSRGFEMREVPREDGDGSWVVCSGYASVTCADMRDDSNAYEMEDAFGPWVESTVRGFASKTLGEGADVAFLVNHGGVTMARTKARTLDVSEDLTGLRYEGRLNPTRPDVQILRAAVTDGAVDESSFAFRVVRQKWSDDYSRRWLLEINLDKGDVSPVNFGASPRTADHPLTMRSAMSLLNARGITSRSFLDALGELRAGKTISQATRDVLEPILANLAAIDKMVDADQPTLADLLGVDNPDTDDDDSGGGDDGMMRALLVPDHTARARMQLAARSRA